MITLRLNRLVGVVGLVAFLSSLPLLAQNPSEIRYPGDSKLFEELQQELSQFAVDFWTPRFNTYKQEIDRTFSPVDLARLNELRVRYSLLKEEERKAQEAMTEKWREERARYQAEHPDEYESVTMDTSSNLSPAEAMVITDEAEYADGIDTMAPAESRVGEPVYATMDAEAMEAEESTYAATDEMAIADVGCGHGGGYIDDGESVSVAVLPASRSDVDTAISVSSSEEQEAEEYDYHSMSYRMPEITDEMIQQAKIGQELSEIPAVAKWMARNYQSNLESLKETVIDDYRRFLTLFIERIKAFKQKHSAELPTDPMSRAMFSYFDNEGIGQMFSDRRFIEMSYYQSLESEILLYNGGSIERLLSPIGGNISEESMKEASALKSITPNPASITASVAYNLREPASQLTIRLVDGRGEVAFESIKGAQPAGDGTSTIDLSGLSNGSYLCTLTIQSAKGEQVFSRVISVVR